MLSADLDVIKKQRKKKAMQIVFKQLTILYVFFLIGWLIGKIKKEKAAHADILSVLLVNIFLPCKVFHTFATQVTVSYFANRYCLLLSSLALLGILSVFSLLVSKLLSKNKYEQKVYSYSLVITNYGYLGYTLIDAVFGTAVLAEFMLFAIPFAFYTYTVGYVLLTGGNPIKRLINPMTIAILLGMLVGLTGMPIPDIISKTTSMASACVGPMSMLLTGITLSTFAVKDMLSGKVAYVFCVLRLVVIPATVYLVCRLLHLDALLPMALIITSMPCGLNTIVFPKLVGEDCRPGARLALITHAFSLITIPFWLSLI